jgi:hypothetical protein
MPGGRTRKRKDRRTLPPRREVRGRRGPGTTGLLATRGRKAAAVIGGAVLVGIGGYIATAIWTGAGKVLHPTGPPLEVHVVATDVYNSGHPWAPYFIVPYSVAAGPEALPARARRSPTTFVDPMLVRDHRAVAGGPQIVRLRLRGLDDRPVTVSGIRALVTKRDRPVRGWYVAITPGCGGDVVRTAPIDLDRPSRPVAFRGLAGAREQIALSVTPGATSSWSSWRPSLTAPWSGRPASTTPLRTGTGRSPLTTVVGRSESQARQRAADTSRGTRGTLRARAS